MESAPHLTARPDRGSGRRDIDAAVHVQQLQHLALRRSDILAHMIVAAATAACLWPLYPPWLPPIWCGLLLAVLLVRDGIQQRFSRAPLEAQADPRWGTRVRAGALAAGAVWALVGSAFAITDDLPRQGLALAVLGGMTIAGIARNAASTKMMIAFVAPIIGFAAVMLLIHPSQIHLGVAAMLGAFGLVLATTGRSLHQSVNADLRLTLELMKTGATLGSSRDGVRAGAWEVDAATGAVLWSDEIFHLFGRTSGAQAPSIEFMLAAVHPDDRETVRAALADWLACKVDLAIEHRISDEAGAARWIHQFGFTQHDAGGKPIRHTAMAQDITHRKLAEEQLQFANVVMKTQLESSEYAVLVVSKEQRVLAYNERFSTMFDCPRDLLEEGVRQDITERIVKTMKYPNKYSERVNQFYDNPGEDGQDDLELADGRFVHRYTVTLTAPDGQYLGRAWYYRDVTEERAALAQAVRTARLDPLTGLANRVAFVEDLQAAIAAHTDTGRAFAILYMDLDHFKDVNDALGHPAGDDLVRAVAQRLTAACRLTDLIARFGGDEFAVIAMDVATEAAASSLATHLIEVISEPYVVRGVPVRISASVGIALRTPGDADADTMLSQADLALYSAKAQGRSAHRAFTREMDTEVRTRLALGAELHQAIEADDLFLLYQPQIELGSRRVVGVEALVRWRHPERGVLSPDLFIPVAEQTGGIGKLGHWVTTTACRQAAAWLHEGAPSVRMAINVSTLQFKSPLAFETDIEDALAQSGLPPACLELELTETVLMNAFKGNENPLWRLRERGLTLAIDDFGTGYSSLDYLRRFPVDRIKIAQNFVRDLETSPGDAAIVKATIGLARELKIDVIAEGVERPRQLELLQAWGCTEAQGYLIARPLPADQIPPLLLGDDPLKAVA